MLVDEVARPQEISRAFRNSPEIHGRAPLLSVLRAAYASDEGLATFTRGTRGVRLPPWKKIATLRDPYRASPLPMYLYRERLTNEA